MTASLVVAESLAVRLVLVLFLSPMTAVDAVTESAAVRVNVPVRATVLAIVAVSLAVRVNVPVLATESDDVTVPLTVRLNVPARATASLEVTASEADRVRA